MATSAHIYPKATVDTNTAARTGYEWATCRLEANPCVVGLNMDVEKMFPSPGHTVLASWLAQADGPGLVNDR